MKFNWFYCLFLLPSLVQAQDPFKLWYQQPAEKWTEALPIGNGRMGAMIYGGVQEEHLQFNESSFWTGMPRAYARNGASDYLETIRKALLDGKQKQADSIAEKHFMGLKTKDDAVYAQEKNQWVSTVTKDLSFATVGFNDASWKTMTLPTINGWEIDGRESLDGSVWFRVKFQLPKNWVGKTMKLDLGRIRDVDFTYVNGKLVGSTESTTNKRSYTIDPNLLQAGENTLAIQVLNFYDKGGFIGLKEDRKIFVVYPIDLSPEQGIELPLVWKYYVQHQAPPTVPQYQATYQPFGDLYFSMKGVQPISNYKRSLDISTAIAHTEYESNGVVYQRDYIASAPKDAIITRFAANQSGKISLIAKLGTIHPQYQLKKIDPSTIGIFIQQNYGVLKGVAYLRVKALHGKLQVFDNRIELDGADEAVFYLVAASSYQNYQDITGNPAGICSQLLSGLNTQNFDAIVKQHTKDYQQLYQRLQISFGKDNTNIPTDQRIKAFTPEKDPQFFAMYLQYGRYLMLASSRANSKHPANLQGIWNNQLNPPWGSKYTSNINLQMNYWPAESLNLSESTAPLFNAIQELSVTGKATAKAHYGAEGWVLHHNTDLWRGTAPINAANHGIWVTGGAWLCLHIWEHYLFTQDKDFLKQNYPILKSASTFFTQFLSRDPASGKLISSPSNSPENGGLVAGPTMDHQIIRELYKNTVAAAKLLGVDPDFQQLLTKQSGEIAPNTIGKYGQLQEWLQDRDDTANKHRHVSHLWGVFPGTDIVWKDSAMMKAARQSLRYRGDEGTGWSLAWKTNLWARFKDGDHTLMMASKLLSSAEEEFGTGEKGGVYKNLFDAHPPFQIDGNFGGAAGIAEMLLQSHQGYLEILPALPKLLSSGSISGLVARGGFEVSIVWKEGVLEKLIILSKAGADCKLVYGNKQSSFHTTKGAQYVLDKDLKL